MKMFKKYFGSKTLCNSKKAETELKAEAELKTDEVEWLNEAVSNVDVVLTKDGKKIGAIIDEVAHEALLYFKAKFPGLWHKLIGKNCISMLYEIPLTPEDTEARIEDIQRIAESLCKYEEKNPNHLHAHHPDSKPLKIKINDTEIEFPASMSRDLINRFLNSLRQRDVLNLEGRVSDV